MVDSVNIENVGGDNGIASEVTLLRLLATMELMANKTGADNKMVIKKANEQYKKSIKDLDKKTKEAAESKVKNTKEVKKSTKATKEYSVALGIATRSMSSFATSVTGLVGKLIDGGDRLSDFTQYVPIVGSSLTTLANYIDDTFEAFQTLSMSGASFGNSLNTLRLTATSARLSLDQFTNLVANNTEKLSMMSGSVTKGAKAVSNMTDQLGSTRQELLSMGFSFEDINEAMLDYAVMTRSRGRIETRNTSQVAKQAANYATTLQTLSKLTGKSVDQLKEEQMAQQNDVAFQLKMANMSGEAAEKIRQGMAEAAAAGPAAVARFKETVMGLPPMTRETQLFAATMGESSAMVERSARMAMNARVTAAEYEEGRSRRMAEITAEQLESARSMANVIAAGAASGEGIGKELAEIYGELGIKVEEYADLTGNKLVNAIQADIAATEEEQKNRDATTAAMGMFKSVIADVRNALTEAFISSGLMTMFVKGMKRVIGVLGNEQVMAKIKGYLMSFSSGIKEFIAAFEDDPIAAIKNSLKNIGKTILDKTVEIVTKYGPEVMEAIKEEVPPLLKKIGDSLKEGIVSLFTNPYVLGVLATSIVTLLAKDKLVSLLSSKSSAGGSGAGRAAGRAGAGLGKGIGAGVAGLGKGIGTGIGGVLKGIATGLSAFASLPVAAGMAVFSAAILAIGGAVAGATWMLGESLPNFAEGLKSFEELDGEKLQSVGKGVLLLGGGLAAMGAGEVVGFFGKMAGIAGKGWDLITGGDSPIEKLQKFASYNITQAQVDQIELNVQALQTYASGMSSLGAGTALGALGSIAEGISSWVSKSPLEKIQEFANETINRRGLDNNLKAVKDFQAVFGEMSPGGSNNQSRLMKLDIDNVIGYAEAINELTESLEKMNEELSRDNNGFKLGRGTNAGDILGQTNKNKSESDVNTTTMIRVLEEIRDLNRRTLRAINDSGNVN